MSKAGVNHPPVRLSRECLVLGVRGARNLASSGSVVADHTRVYYDPRHPVNCGLCCRPASGIYRFQVGFLALGALWLGVPPDPETSAGCNCSMGNRKHGHCHMIQIWISPWTFDGAMGFLAPQGWGFIVSHDGRFYRYYSSDVTPFLL